MKRRVTFSGEHKEIEDIIGLYYLNKDAILAYKKQIHKGTLIPKEELVGYTSDELDYYFTGKIGEFETLISLDMLSSVEAKLKMDYLTRVYNRNKDSLSRNFQAIYREKFDRVSLKEDILENWQQAYPDSKKYINEYKSALRFRNWLAHGSYWNPKLKKSKYDILTVYSICNGLLKNLKI